MLPFSSFSEKTSDVMCLEGGWLICRSVCRLPPPTPPQSHVRNPTEDFPADKLTPLSSESFHILNELMTKNLHTLGLRSFFEGTSNIFAILAPWLKSHRCQKKRGTNICTSRKLIRSVLCQPGSPGGQIKRDEYTRCSFLMVFP